MIAAGIGCCAGCAAEEILRAIELAAADGGVALGAVRVLCSAEFKRAEAGLRRAAEALDRSLVLFEPAALAVHAPGALTRSSAVEARCGLPSLAETAALAGAAALAPAGSPVRLLGPRRVTGRASCALARVGLAAPGGGSEG